MALFPAETKGTDLWRMGEIEEKDEWGGAVCVCEREYLSVCVCVLRGTGTKVLMI